MNTSDRASRSFRRPLRGRALAGAVAASVLAVGLLGVGRVSTVMASSGFDTHQGVDRCADQAHQKVQDLWNGTPFYNYGLYIGGAESAAVHCTSTVAFSNFVQSVGFGIIPIWDDLQAPCTGNSKRMSSTASTARNQGITSAHNAQAAMSAFGFSTVDNVWLDMEIFDETNASCRTAVHSFIDGWDSVLGGVDDAGVYASHGNVQSLAGLANVPSAVWIARWDVAINSVWGIADVPNTLWKYDQRIHQYRHKTYNLPFGCSGAACTDGSIVVDVDCVNAWISGGVGTSDNDTNETNEANSVTAEPNCNAPAQ